VTTENHTRTRTSSDGGVAPAKGARREMIKKKGEATKALDEEIRNFMEVHGSLNGSEALGRHRMAQIAERVRANPKSKYGSRTAAMERLAREGGLDLKTLYKYASLARLFTEADFIRFLAEAKKSGKLTWSHFMEVADVTEFEKVEALIERVIKEGLSVRALRDIIKPPIVQPKQEEPKHSGSLPLATLSELNARVEAITDETQTWERNIFVPIQASQGEKSHELVKALKGAQARLNALVETARTILSKIADALNPVDEAEEESAREAVETKTVTAEMGPAENGSLSITIERSHVNGDGGEKLGA
jgi:hypothetical protein